LLAVLFGLGAQRLGLRKTSTIGADVVTRQELEALLPRSDPHEVTKALEAIAVEVERIGEGQRYLTKILVERSPRAIRSPTNLNGPEDG
jgi:hypothetical protein